MKLSIKIGKGTQTFRIRDFKKQFSEINNLGSDRKNFLKSRKIVNLTAENKLYVLVEVTYKDIEEFIIPIDDQNITDIDWAEIVKKTSSLRWRGSPIEDKYIN